VLSITDNGDYKACGAFAEDNGKYECYQVITEGGRRIIATGNHPLLTIFGWKGINELDIGESVLVPTSLPVHGVGEFDENVLKLLAYMIGDGCLSNNCMFSQEDNKQLKEFKEVVHALGGGVKQKSKYDYSVSGLLDIFRKYELWGKKSGSKEIPAFVFSLTDRLVGKFLSRLFSTDGWYSESKRIGYCSKNRVLCEQIQLLLLRFNIFSTITTIHNKQYETSYHTVNINEISAVYRFGCEIGIWGKLNRYMLPDIYKDKEYKYKSKIQRYQHCNKNLNFDKIKEITNVGVRHTVAIEVPETGNYVSSFVEHNTTAALNLGIREACRFPNGKYGHIAPTQVQARNIIWDDPNMLKKYLPEKREMDWKRNEQKMLVTFENGSMIKFGGADEPDSWRGVEFIGVTCDEWSLIKENLWTEILWPIMESPLLDAIAKYQTFRWTLFIYTPKPPHHASRMFDDACCLSDGGTLPNLGVAQKLSPNTFASRVDGELSGIYGDAALKVMQEKVRLGKIPKAIYDQEIKCSRITSEEMTLITSDMINALNNHHATTRESYREVRKIVSIDPAFGGDVCRIMGMENCEVKIDDRIRDRHMTNEIVMAAKVVAAKIGTKNIIIDVIGVGLGVCDGLAVDAAGYNVQRFNSSHKAKENKDTLQALQCANLRAEAYLYASHQIHHFNTGPIKDNELIRQLPLASRYKVQSSSGKLIILPKDKIKEELGCSPDDADCWVMGVWGSQHVQPEIDGQIITVGAMSCVPDSYQLGIG